MVLPNDDEIVLRIILDAKQANAELQKLMKEINGASISTAQLQKSIQTAANLFGKSYRDMGENFKKMYAAQVDASGATKELGTNLKSAFNEQVNQAVKNLDKNIDGAAKSGKGFTQILNLIRGTLVAIAVFRVFNFLEDTIRKATLAAEDFETTLYRIRNAERILSESGVDITTKDLLDTVQQLKKELPIFSETDLSKQVSLIAIMTKDLGLNDQQILDLARAIGILNVRSADTEDLMTTTNKVLQAIVSKGTGVGSLGIKFSEAAVTAKAVELGYLKAGQSLSDLSDEQRDFVVGQAKVAITLANTNGEIDTLNEYVATNTGLIQEGTSAWEDFTKELGQVIVPIKANFTSLLTLIGPLLQTKINDAKAGFVQLFALANAYAENFISMLQGKGIPTLEDFGKSFDKYLLEYTKRFFPEETAQGIDTITESVNNLGDALKDLSEIKGFDKFIDDIAKLQQKLAETQADFDLEQARAAEDYAIEVARIQQDYEIKRQRVIEDANQKIADANHKHREQEKNEEAKFQEQMRQLREKFLFNLEDALRERDARQVLRLQKQYQMDKTALTNEYNLRQQQQDQEHADNIARIKRERDDRLAELAQEEQIRLQREAEDFALRQARAQEDHEIDMARMQQELDDKLKAFAEALGEEYNLNEEGVNQLYKLLQDYYGPGGKFDALYNYSASSIISNAQGILNTLNQLIAYSAQATAQLSALGMGDYGTRHNTPLPSNYYSGGDYGTRHNIGYQAEGGTYLATRPTTATFGDAGPEIAQFIPVNKLKASSGIGSIAGGNNGVGGLLRLMVDLSPDLEARIVDKSLENVSAVVRNQVRQR